ncbi:MAG: cation:proton antiporter [Bradyrhizobiaceae bacterium]|nr:cation:proton antiporter [Bradyrhizobiaceae bacterium]
MPHETPLLVTIVLGLVLAFACGFIASRLRLPPLVGYLVAGIIVGPYTPGPAVDAHLATELSEVGVILLMFGVGLHFSTADLLAVRWIAIPGAVGQIAVATAIGVVIAMSWGWTLGGGLVLGLALSVASTVVLLRALDERNTLGTANGRIAVGWLIVEDLAMVLTLVLLPALAGLLGGKTPDGSAGGIDGQLLLTVAITLGKVGVFGAIILMLGPRIVPWLLSQAARTGSHELFTLSVLAIALGIAYGSAKLFDVSFALGAFCAGIVLAKSELSHRAAEESLPLQNAFAVLFFVSVGMLFDPSIIVREPIEVIAVLLIILVGKSVAAFAIVLLLGYPISTATLVSASLAQVGEFSFILAGLGIALGLLPSEGKDLILAGALLSITLNPLAFATVRPLTDWINAMLDLLARGEPARRARLARLDRKLSELRQHAEPAAKLGLQPTQLMSKFAIFGDLTADQRAELLTLFKPRSAAPGERVIRAGDVGNEMFFISSGAVEVAVGGKKIQLGPGDFFGEMALLTGARRIADVTAIDYCLFLTLGKDDFDKFIGRYAELRQRLDEVAAERAEMNRREAQTPEPG